MKNLEVWLQKDHSYEELFEKINHYKQYDKKIAQLLSNEEFYFGRYLQQLFSYSKESYNTYKIYLSEHF